MGWESRETSKHRYLFRCECRGGRGIRRYVGPQRDALVRVLARSDGLTLAQRQAIRIANLKEQARYLDSERRVRQLEAVASLFARAYRFPPRAQNAA